MLSILSLKQKIRVIKNFVLKLVETNLSIEYSKSIFGSVSNF